MANIIRDQVKELLKDSFKNVIGYLEKEIDGLQSIKQPPTSEDSNPQPDLILTTIILRLDTYMKPFKNGELSDQDLLDVYSNAENDIYNHECITNCRIIDISQ